MAPLTVIVQNIPVDPYDFHKSFGEVDSREDRIALEQLLAKYGPVQCRYLWSDESDKLCLRRYALRDNFAHVIFFNAADGLRAYEAAKMHQIQMDGRILTLTMVSHDYTPIETLNDDCLMKIFQMLDMDEKIDAEKVCKRWKKLALKSWSSTKSLNLQKMVYEETTCERYLKRCGWYLDEITYGVRSRRSFHLIQEHCRNVKILRLFISDFKEIYLKHLSVMLKELKNLKAFTLTGCTEHLLTFDFLGNLSESMEKIYINVRSYEISRASFNLSKFRNLQSLTLIEYRIKNGALRGIENMENLAHLDFNKSFVHNGIIEKIQNFTKLRTLKIPSCAIHDNLLIKILKNNKGLEVLDISRIGALTDRSVVHASTLPNLRILNVAHCPYVTLSLMDKMPLLETLNCKGCGRVRNEAVGRLIQLTPNLESLNIEDCSITPELSEIANTAVKIRDSGVILEISTTLEGHDIDHDSLSPLLKFDCQWS